MAHLLFWVRNGGPGNIVRVWMRCRNGCERHIPDTFQLIGSLEVGRAAHYADSRAVPSWLCGYGLGFWAMQKFLKHAAHNPNAASGWVGRGGCFATPMEGDDSVA